jgi:hypothetical protein
MAALQQMLHAFQADVGEQLRALKAQMVFSVNHGGN